MSIYKQGMASEENQFPLDERPIQSFQFTLQKEELVPQILVLEQIS